MYIKKKLRIDSEFGARSLRVARSRNAPTALPPIVPFQLLYHLYINMCALQLDLYTYACIWKKNYVFSRLTRRQSRCIPIYTDIHVLTYVLVWIYLYI